MVLLAIRTNHLVKVGRSSGGPPAPPVHEQIIKVDYIKNGHKFKNFLLWKVWAEDKHWNNVDETKPYGCCLYFDSTVLSNIILCWLKQRK